MQNNTSRNTQKKSQKRWIAVLLLLGAVLEQFFAKYASLNSFTETVIRSTERGELMRWPARIGRRHTL